PAPAAPAPLPVSAPDVEPVEAGEEQIVTVESPLYRARFSNRGAQLVDFELLRHPEKRGGDPTNLVAPRDPGRVDFPFAILSSDGALNERVNRGLYTVSRSEERGETVLRFRWSDGRDLVEKTFRLHPDRYLFGFDIEMQTAAPATWRTVVGPGLREILPEEAGNRFATVGFGVVQQAGELEVIQREKAPRFQILAPPIDFAGLQDNYFLAVLKPRESASVTFRSIRIPSPAEGEEGRKELYVGVTAPGNRLAGSAYFGPKEADRLDAAGLENTLQFGFFGFISRILLVALTWVNTFTHNYGWSIVVLTAIIKLLLFPLQHKSMVSMKKMQQVQPKMNAIKDRYKKARTDPEQRQKMNLEIMKLYKQEGINPASGCVPLLLQLPILWAFYTLLSYAIELRGAPWILWIQDLSVKDPYYITPILMTVTMFLQQWITPTTADPVQRRVFLIMPIVFGWLFKEFPSGLVLYWFVQNILSIIQQLILNRYWKSHPAAEATR
ncbi:MAG: membrane protein insertase YidC, partial [Thermoanaerobaculia bacterium]